ncbi:MAG: alpha/beta hydrolase [Candidatus Heimdallarchaeota archaeon]|nr:alpha/beta hydrolase [Candidatus Heimdallarchaeota archaeon]MCK4771230.1 alpha/beta hydrolase [Candidatus Heimdallarchaeota archaeon]
MNSANLDKEFPQEMTFIKQSTKEQIIMSDEQRVYCFYSNKHENEDKTTIIFIQGVGPGVYSWSDLWDELYKEYNLVIVDSREKPTINLEKNKNCTVQRISLDIVEAINHLKIKDKDIIFIGSSLGAFYVAHCIGQGWIKPKGCFLIGPSIELKYPEIVFRLALILPSFLLEEVGKFIARRFIRNKVIEGFQKKVYFERVDKIDVKRWKKCSSIRKWKASEDYKNINCPAYIFSTTEDKYHRVEETEKVRKLIKNSKFIEVPDYNFMRIKPRVIEFARIIKELIKKL